MSPPTLTSVEPPPARQRNVLVALFDRITEHLTILHAAGVAFYATLALLPALIAIVAVYGLLADPTDVEPQLAELLDALPDDARDLVVRQLEDVTDVEPVGVTVGLAVSLVAVAWAISNAMNSLVIAIRAAHERPSPHTWIQGRVFALALSVIAVMVAAATLWLVVALPEVIGSAGLTSRLERIIDIARWPTAVLISAMAQAVLYRLVLGARRNTWHSVSLGVFASAVTWVAGTVGLSVFVNNISRLDTTFGTLGAVAVLMIWFYWSAFSVLLGAEIDGLTSERRGRRRLRPVPIEDVEVA